MSRIVIIGTPRSGNTWVRGVLRDALNLKEYAAHNYRDFPEIFGERAIIQIHWPREPGFQKFLEKQNFRIIVPTRHPLDVLVSVLHFVRREPLASRWLEGNAEIPVGFDKETPASEGFERYALSFGAENLLSVSYQWSFDGNSISAFYEKLVADPQNGFQLLIESLGHRSDRLDAALTANNFNVFRDTPNFHGWQGKPDLWKKLIPSRTAYRIKERHKIIFSKLGYHVPFYVLGTTKANAAWKKVAI